MKSSVKLTHFGRKSGKRFQVRVWCEEIDGAVWVGSRDIDRNWVRNLEANGRAELDFGSGPKAYTATRCHDMEKLERFVDAVLARHPIMYRFIEFMARGKTPGAFRLVVSDASEGGQESD